MEFIFVNGIKLYAPSYREELIDEAFRLKKILVAVNAEKILMANQKFAEFISENIGYPDGIGAVMVLKKHGHKKVQKIPGVELWLEIIKQRFQSNTFYIVGGKEEVIQATVSKLRLDFSGISILGFRNGYIKSEEEKEFLIQDILEKKPDVVFVAMGSPKQEELMKELHSFHTAVYQGLGGSFDLYIGLTKRAPDWWIKYFKWEGLYRSVSDLTNLKRWKRQKAAFVFLWKVFTGKL